MSIDLLTLELIRQFPGILYSVACVFASIFFPLAMLNGIKAYCAAFATSRGAARNKPEPKQSPGDATR